MELSEEFNKKIVKGAVRDIGTAEIQRHRVADGSIDKERFYRAVNLRFRSERAQMAEWWQSVAIEQLVQDVGGDLVRQLFRNYSIGRLSGEYRAYVQIPLLDENKFVLKHRMDVTVAEAQRMERYHTSKERAHTKERRFWHEVLVRAEAHGLGPDDRISGIPDLREEDAI